MKRGLILFAVSALAQQQQPPQQLHRPWNRLGERLGLRADTPNPLRKPSAADAEPISSACAEDEVMCSVAMQRRGANCVQGACLKLPDIPPALGSTDANGCQKGGGYSWCATKSKCLRAWEEPCEEPISSACAEDEVMCSVAMQRRGTNCVQGACLKLPDIPPALGGARDANGCVKGGGYSWCESKQKCLRHWEEPCEEVAGSTETAPMGATKDEHGCVLGGGFRWCENKQKCLRQWEEPCEEQTDGASLLRNIVSKHLTPEQQAKMDNVLGNMKSKQAQFRDTIQQKIAEFQAKKSATPGSEVTAMGATKDEHGCVLGGGFQWCENKQKCLRQWEEPCEEEVRAPAGAAKDEHGCVLGGGFRWCENKQKCLRQWEEPCEEEVRAPAGAAKDEHGCVLGGGFQWCENKQKCLRQWEEPCEQAEPSVETTLLNIVREHLTPEQQTEMDKVVDGLKAKQARFREKLQEKIAEFKEKKMGGQFEASLRARMRSRAEGRPARTQEKIGAHEDNRLPGVVKSDAIVDSVM